MSSGSSKCYYCLKKINLLCIVCAECPRIKICIKCFSHGVEGGNHKKIHKYMIKRSGRDECLHNSWGGRWLLAEELKLLDGLDNYGYGNWNEISAYLQSHSPIDCRDHYNRFYMSGIMSELLSPSICSFTFVKEHIYPNKLFNCADDNGLSCYLRPNHQRSLGYLPYRDEFEFEYMNSAEEVLNSIYTTSTWDELDKAFYLALMGIYNQYIEKRYFRHHLARSHNLVTHLMHDLMCSQSKQKLSKLGVIRRGSFTKPLSYSGVSQIKAAGRRFAHNDRITGYSYNCTHRISNLNLNCDAIIAEREDNNSFIQSQALTSKHWDYLYDSVPISHLQHFCRFHQATKNDHRDSTTANLNISGMNTNFDIPCTTRTLLVRDDSCLTESSTSSEILDSGISSAESSNSTTSCTKFSNQSNLNPIKGTIDSQLANRRVITRPRFNSDSVCSFGIVKLNAHYLGQEDQTSSSKKLFNDETSGVNFMSNSGEYSSQFAYKGKVPSSVPLKRRRGRPPRKPNTLSSLSHNQETEQQSRQIPLTCFISNSESSNVGSCVKNPLQTSENTGSHINTSLDSDVYNCLRSLNWLIENVETPLSMSVHRRFGRHRPKASTSYSHYSDKGCLKTFFTHPQWLKPFFRYLSTSEAETFLNNLERERVLRIEISQLMQQQCEFSVMRTAVTNCLDSEDSTKYFDYNKNCSLSCYPTSPSPPRLPSLLTTSVEKNPTTSIHHRSSNLMKL
ncbi:Transcriptional adapter 2-beta, partial [Schistosoma japonicum]